MKLIVDCETDGLLDTLSVVHCLVLKDVDTGQIWSQSGSSIEEGIRLLQDADQIIGHNIIKFDIPALQKVYPWFQPRGKLLDTLVLARLCWPEIDAQDHVLILRGILPKKLRGKYSLEAFGYRLNNWKGDYSIIMQQKGLNPWAKWCPEMQDYCEQDVEVTELLYRKCLKIWKGYDRATLDRMKMSEKRNQPASSVPIVPISDESIWLEMDVARIIARQERWGFSFNVKEAEQFYVKLIQQRDELGRKLKQTFGSWIAPDGPPVTVKKTRRVNRKDYPPIGYKQKKDGTSEPIFVKELYEEGSRYTKIKFVEFNPNSNHHCTSRLKKLFGWKPTEFTPSGDAKLDDTILSQLPWPEAQLLSQYMTLIKRIGQLAEGKQAWLRKERDGRIHGGVITVGAVTRRMTHNNPNIAQVPKVGSPYGAECRNLFTASKGYVLVGCDADALELRCLGGYMAKYDGGAYIETILSGDKAQGTDMHSVNARALGLDPKKTYPVDGKEIGGRDIAKTWFYAFIYGAGDHKLGTIMGASGTDKSVIAVGRNSRENFLTGLPALRTLSEMVKKRGLARGFLIGLDGGKLKIRHAHAALNTLLQSAGAVIMKKALVILDSDLQNQGLVPQQDYEFCANVHDEWQLDVKPEHAELVMKLAEDSIRKAGEALNFGCPLAGNADKGMTWRDTH